MGLTVDLGTGPQVVNAGTTDVHDPAGDARPPGCSLPPVVSRPDPHRTGSIQARSWNPAEQRERHTVRGAGTSAGEGISLYRCRDKKEGEQLGLERLNPCLNPYPFCVLCLILLGGTRWTRPSHMRRFTGNPVCGLTPDYNSCHLPLTATLHVVVLTEPRDNEPVRGTNPWSPSTIACWCGRSGSRGLRSARGRSSSSGLTSSGTSRTLGPMRSAVPAAPFWMNGLPDSGRIGSTAGPSDRLASAAPAIGTLSPTARGRAADPWAVRREHPDAPGPRPGGVSFCVARVDPVGCGQDRG